MPTLAQTIAQQYREEQKKAKAARGRALDEFEAAGGFRLTPEQLRGALLPMRDRTDEDLATWAARGAADIAREEAEKAAPLQTVRLTFPDGGKGPKPREMKPFTWVGPLKCYVAEININKARKLAQDLGGTLKVEGAEVMPLAAE